MKKVGEILRTARIEKGIELTQIEKDTRIRKAYLEAIEDEKWDVFSSRTYISGTIRNYARYLGLEGERVVAIFRRDFDEMEEIKFRKRVAKDYFQPTTIGWMKLGIFILVVIVTSYIGYQLKLFLTPPSISITSPTTFVFQREEKMTIIGRTDKDATVFINSEQVFPDKSGSFTKDIPLPNDKNPLLIQVEGANGKKSTLKKEFIRKFPLSDPSISPTLPTIEVTKDSDS